VSGQALFSREAILKDEILIIQGGRILHIKDVDAKENQGLAYHGFQIKTDFYIYPFVFEDVAILDGIFTVNHSCSPNSGFADAITLVSMRDIERGEEICFDYAMTDTEQPDEIPWVAEKCLCGSSECRGKITGSDWKLTELQKKYKGYFSPHVAKSIADTLREG
jgi:SET domain-containing protein